MRRRALRLFCADRSKRRKRSYLNPRIGVEAVGGWRKKSRAPRKKIENCLRFAPKIAKMSLKHPRILICGSLDEYLILFTEDTPHFCDFG